MGRDKYHPYQTVGDVIWLALTDKKDSPPLNPHQKDKDEQKSEEQEEQKKEKR